MPWFKIDDSSHSHPKFMRAGNAALGLWLRCGAYSAQHLLEGVVPGFIAKAFGSEAQANKLVKADLWHQTGHNCPRCPQPADGDYVIHDFFEAGRNSTRAQVEASRKAAADRQAKQRARAAEMASMDDPNEKTPQNRGGFGKQMGSESSEKSSKSDPQFLQSDAGQEGSSQRDAMEGVTPSLPKPCLTSTSFGSTGASKQDRDSASSHPSDGPTPEWVRPLQDLMWAGGLGGLRWNFKGRWIQLQELIKQKGAAAMADHAIRAAGFASQPVVYASYFIEGWGELSNQPPAGAGPPQLKSVPGSRSKHQNYQAPTDHSVYENGFTNARADTSRG
jgi:hypothetical protein